MGKFDGEKNATREFIAITAMKSIGAPKVQVYLGTDEEAQVIQILSSFRIK